MNQYFLDGADRTHRFRMSARLPTGTEYPDNRGVLARKNTGRQRAAGRDSNTLNDAVRKDRQRFSAFGGK